MKSSLLTLLLVLLPITVTVKGDCGQVIDTANVILPIDIIDLPHHGTIWGIDSLSLVDSICQHPIHKGYNYRMVEVVDTVGWKIHLYNAMQNHNIAPDTMYFSDSVSQTYFCDSYVLIPIIIKKTALFISPTGDTVRCNCGGEL